MSEEKNLSKERQELINKYLAHPFFNESMINEFIDFLRLKTMIFNESERQDLEDISDGIAIGIGSLEQVWDDLYAFNHRINEEKLLESFTDKS